MSTHNETRPAGGVDDSSKAVERFDCTNGGTQFCQGCYTMTPDPDGEYIRYEDYAKLEQRRAALVEALQEAAKELEWAGAEFASQRARAALRAAGVEP